MRDGASLFDIPTETRLNYKEVGEILAREGKAGRGSTEWAVNPFAQNVWVYSAVTLITQTFSQIPLGLWTKSTGGSKQKRSRRKGYVQVENDPIVDFLEAPNEIHDQQSFLETWASTLLTGGNVWIQQSGLNSKNLPLEFLIWGVQSVRPGLNKETGALTHWLLTIKNKEYKIPLDEMIHTRLPNPYHPFMGLPPTSCVAAQLDADYARTVFDKAFFKNNASPDAVLTYKLGPLSHDQRKQIRDSWHEFHGGADKAGGLAVIGGDFDFHVWGVSHSQSQFLENREFTREEVGAAFHVPSTLLNAVQRNGLTKEAMKAANRTLYDNAIFPLCAKFKKALNKNFVQKRNPKYMLDFEIDLLPIMSDYLMDKAEVLDILVGSGIPVNDAIQMLDFNCEPVDGGEKGFLPGNYVPISALAKIEKMLVPTNNPSDRPPPKNPSNPKSGSTPKPKSKATFDLRGDNALPYYGNTITIETGRSISLISNFLKDKIKKSFFNLRKESLRFHNFKLENAKRDWLNAVYPTCLAVCSIGMDEVRNGGQWATTLNPKSQEEVSEIFGQITREFKECTDFDEDLRIEVEGIVLRSIEFLEQAKRDLEGGMDPRDVFSSLQNISKQVSEHLVKHSLNAGRYIGALRENHRIVPAHTCRKNTGGRYPGDHELGLPDVIGCLCDVAYTATEDNL